MFDLIVDGSFMTDVVLTFFTVYDDGTGSYISNRRKIAKNYITGWFFLDFFTSLPLQVLEKLANVKDVSDAKALRLARLPRLYRLLRIFRLFKLLRVLKSNAKSGTL